MKIRILAKKTVGRPPRSNAQNHAEIKIPSNILNRASQYGRKQLKYFSVSVVIPTYNRAHLLTRALASVVAQTRPPDEIIVVDDGSMDNTEEIATSFKDVTYYRMQANSGAAAARNFGVERSSSIWVAFLDSDDIWACNRLEEQLRHVQGKANIGLLCSGVTVQERSGAIRYHGFPFPSPCDGWTFSEFQTYPFSTSTWLIRKRELIQCGGFDETLPNCEDLDLLAKLVSIIQIEVLQAPLVTKFNQIDSIDADLERVEASYCILFERYCDLWRKSPKALVNSHMRLAAMRMAAGHVRLAQSAMISAWRLQPLSLSIPIRLLYSIFGSGIYAARERRLKG